MEQRGAKAHRDGWDAAMLLSMRGVLVSILARTFIFIFILNSLLFLFF